MTHRVTRVQQANPFKPPAPPDPPQANPPVQPQNQETPRHTSATRALLSHGLSGLWSHALTWIDCWRWRRWEPLFRVIILTPDQEQNRRLARLLRQATIRLVQGLEVSRVCHGSGLVPPGTLILVTQTTRPIQGYSGAASPTPSSLAVSGSIDYHTTAARTNPDTHGRSLITLRAVGQDQISAPDLLDALVEQLVLLYRQRCPVTCLPLQARSAATGQGPEESAPDAQDQGAPRGIPTEFFLARMAPRPHSDLREAYTYPAAPADC